MAAKNYQTIHERAEVLHRLKSVDVSMPPISGGMGNQFEAAATALHASKELRLLSGAKFDRVLPVPESSCRQKSASSDEFWVDTGVCSCFILVNDSRADPACAPQAGRQIANHRRVAARFAVGAHSAAHQRLPEMRARRRPPGFCADGDVSGPPHASVQRAPRAGCRGAPRLNGRSFPARTTVV